MFKSAADGQDVLLALCSQSEHTGCMAAGSSSMLRRGSCRLPRRWWRSARASSCRQGRRWKQGLHQIWCRMKKKQSPAMILGMMNEPCRFACALMHGAYWPRHHRWPVD